ncbi:MAG: hypothetical protein JWO40_308 [Candidatus Doudnabacteria bacterium]|nr:hypothetical protein [Candidatus Doudnabacteria bacterium]
MGQTPEILTAPLRVGFVGDKARFIKEGSPITARVLTVCPFPQFAVKVAKPAGVFAGNKMLEVKAAFAPFATAVAGKEVIVPLLFSVKVTVLPLLLAPQMPLAATVPFRAARGVLKVIISVDGAKTFIADENVEPFGQVATNVVGPVAYEFGMLKLVLKVLLEFAVLAFVLNGVETELLFSKEKVTFPAVEHEPDRPKVPFP